jgi:hypothetical protein
MGKKIADASMEQLQEIKELLAGGTSYYQIEKKYGYNRNVVRSWWLALEDKERKIAALNNVHRKNEVVQLAFGSTDMALVSTDGKIDTAFDKAIEELIFRLSGDNSKTLSDRDLISATKLLYDMRRDRIKDEEAQPTIQNNTQNIINVFSEAIDNQINSRNE